MEREGKTEWLTNLRNNNQKSADNLLSKKEKVEQDWLTNLGNENRKPFFDDRMK